MVGKPYTPPGPYNRASLGRDPTPSRTMVPKPPQSAAIRSAVQSSRLDEVLRGLEAKQPYDRVLELARQSPALKARGLPGDLHETLDLSDNGLIQARAALKQSEIPADIWSNGFVRPLPGSPSPNKHLPKSFMLRWGKVTGSGPRGEVTPADEDLWTRIAVGEAENQSDEGLGAVVGVMGNRSKIDEKPIAEVLGEGNGSQFNAWKGPRRRYTDKLDPRSPSYQRANRIVREVLAGADPSDGAYYFYNPDVQKRRGYPKPAFDNGAGQRRGDHLFFPYEAGHPTKRR